MQAEFRSEDIETGDIVVNFDPDDFAPIHMNRAEGSTVRLGLKHQFTPKSVIIASVYSRNRDEELAETLTDGDFVTHIGASSEIRSWTAEVRHLFRSGNFTFTTGLGHFSSERQGLRTVSIPDPDPELSFTDIDPFHEEPEQTNAYAYSSVDLPGRTTLTLGASGDFYRRSSLTRNQFNPKVGLAWRPTSKTTVRVAAFRTLNRAFVSTQTIEPTQVAGFNQLFADREGDEARHYGAALDHKFSDRVFTGAEYCTARPQASCGIWQRVLWRLGASGRNGGSRARLSLLGSYQPPVVER